MCSKHVGQELDLVGGRWHGPKQKFRRETEKAINRNILFSKLKAINQYRKPKASLKHNGRNSWLNTL